jgi:hypothetical protein
VPHVVKVNAATACLAMSSSKKRFKFRDSITVPIVEVRTRPESTPVRSEREGLGSPDLAGGFGAPLRMLQEAEVGLVRTPRKTAAHQEEPPVGGRTAPRQHWRMGASERHT